MKSSLSLQNHTVVGTVLACFSVTATVRRRRIWKTRLNSRHSSMGSLDP